MDNNNLINNVKSHIGGKSIGELSPGSTKRRYEPIGGLSRHNERIHRESKYVDNNKDLPFTFSKPKRNIKSKYIRCLSCGNITRVSKNTVGIICSSCKKYSKIEEVDM